MKIKLLARSLVTAMLSTGLLIMGVSVPTASARAPHHPSTTEQYAKLLADLYKVSFRTPYDKDSLGTSRDLKLDPLGNLYLCAHFDHALAPFTDAAKQMSCQAEPGQPLVLIGTGTEWSRFEGYPTEQAMRDRVNADLDHVAPGYPQVLLDGRSLPLSKVFTHLTSVDRIASKNVIGVVPDSGQTEFVAGAWMTVVRAPAGRHTVEFRAGIDSAGQEVGGIATIDARPCRSHDQRPEGPRS